MQHLSVKPAVLLRKPEPGSQKDSAGYPRLLLAQEHGVTAM